MIEISITITLAAVLTTLATPGFRDVVGHYRLDAAARDVSELIRSARVLAVTRGANVRVVFSEIDRDYKSANTGAGVVRLEILNSSEGTGTWQSVDGSTIPVNGSCEVAGQRISYCVDLKTAYEFVSIVWVDPVGGGTENPYLEYRSDGFVANSLQDFLLGIDANSVQVVLYNKQTSGSIHGKVLSVDRAGWVSVAPYQG